MSQPAFWRPGEQAPPSAAAAPPPSQAPAPPPPSVAVPTARATRGPGMSDKLKSLRFMTKRLDGVKQDAAAAAAAAAAADAAWTLALAPASTSASAATASSAKRRLVCVLDDESTSLTATAELVAVTANGATLSSRRSFHSFNATLESQARGGGGAGGAVAPDVDEAEMAGAGMLHRGGGGVGGVSAPARHVGGKSKGGGADTFQGFKRSRR